MADRDGADLTSALLFNPASLGPCGNMLGEWKSGGRGGRGEGAAGWGGGSKGGDAASASAGSLMARDRWSGSDGRRKVMTGTEVQKSNLQCHLVAGK